MNRSRCCLGPNEPCIMWVLSFRSSEQKDILGDGGCDTTFRKISLTICSEGHISIANESASIQLTQCRFPGLAISNAEILIYF